MGEPSLKSRAWTLFDRIVRDAEGEGLRNPWTRGDDGNVTFQPDFATLERLLGAPLHLAAGSQTGVPALALDVWLAYELRRAGFDADAVWPRASAPRVIPQSVTRLLAALPSKERGMLLGRMASGFSGVTADSASVLGKNYFKQVDVLMSEWDTGPEILISTKRMDSSFGKNAANRVEESYGDAKNLRLRHPLAALGFVYGLRSTILRSEPAKAEWLIDLLAKLGREDDAYHAVALVMIEYDDAVAPPLLGDDSGPEDDAIAAAGLVETSGSAQPEDLADEETHEAIAALPPVSLRHDAVPPELQPARFLAVVVNRVLDATPVNRHAAVRRLRADPRREAQRPA